MRLENGIDRDLEVSEEEGKILHDLIFNIEPRIVLEVGTGHGYSSSFMGAALPTGGILYSLDIENRKLAYVVNDQMIFYKTDLIGFLDDHENIKIDFVFLDSQHQIEKIVEDIELILPNLNKSGVICVHDTVYCPEMGQCLSDYFNGIHSDRLKKIPLFPSDGKWDYKNKETEFGLGIAKRLGGRK